MPRTLEWYPPFRLSIQGFTCLHTSRLPILAHMLRPSHPLELVIVLIFAEECATCYGAPHVLKILLSALCSQAHSIVKI
jgi:hypothetical protein